MTDCTNLPTLAEIEASKLAMDDIQSFTYGDVSPFIDSKGVSRKTINGIIDVVDAAADQGLIDIADDVSTVDSTKDQAIIDILNKVNEVGVIYDSPIRPWSTALLVEDLRAHKFDDEIYIPTKDLPFTTGATFNTDDWMLLQGITNGDLINDLSQAYEFPTVAAMTSSAIAFPVGKSIKTKGHYLSGDKGGNSYIKSASDDGLGIALNAGGFANPQNPATSLNLGIKNDGTVQQTTLVAVLNHLQNSSIEFLAGEYNFTSIPSNIDNVKITGINQSITWTDKKLPISTEIFTGGNDTAIVAGVIRYYDVRPGDGLSGWAFIFDTGQNHNPTLLSGPINRPGGGNTGLILNVDFDAFGLDPAKWTPSGVVCGPDEDLASTGLTVGASVGTTSMTIEMYNNIPIGTTVTWNVGNQEFDVSNANYLVTWANLGNASAARMRIERVGADGFVMGTVTTLRSPMQIVMGGNTSGANDFTLVLSAGRTTSATGPGPIGTIDEYVFLDAAGVRIHTPTANTKFTIIDPQARRLAAAAQDWKNEFGNIWIIGTFVRKT